MAIIMVLIAVAVLAVPIFATVVVSLASVREDRAWSLYRKPQNAADAVARRIVGFHAEGTVPQPKSHRTAAHMAHAAGRFAGHTAHPAKAAAPPAGEEPSGHAGLGSASLSRDDDAVHAGLLAAVS